MKKMKKRNERTLFDEELRLKKISEIGDPLEKLKNINWEIFRPILEKETLKEDRGLGGKPAYDRVLLFKIVILQRFYNISDEQIEYQINDRLSFMRFLGLWLSDDVPDRTTIWLFKEKLSKSEADKKLFELFNKMLEDNNLIVNEGKIIDASFVEVRKQRNSKKENEDIKNGKIPEEWQKDENKKKLSQKDVDARWTKKNNKAYYGYKNHIKVDIKSKIITKYEVTNASVHDSQVLDKLLDEKDENNEVYFDAAYVGQEEIFEKKRIKSKVCEKGYRGKGLTEEQRKENKKKSKIRARVEHVFGFIENSMNRSFIRSIGLVRAKFNIGLMNLTYNIFRYLFLCKAKSV